MNFVLILVATSAILENFSSIPNPLSLPNGNSVHGIAAAPWTSQDGVYSLEAVVTAPQPSFNPLTQICTRNVAPSLVGGVWTLGWTVTAMTTTQQTAAAAANAAAQYAAATGAGLAVTWSSSTGLNGTYALDQTTQFNMTAEAVSILTNGMFANGQSTRNWPTAAGAFLSFTIAQFKALATAIALYLDQLATAQATAAAGGSATWPSASVTVTG